MPTEFRSIIFNDTQLLGEDPAHKTEMISGDSFTDNGALITNRSNRSYKITK
jgi:hypothetical protein